MFNKSVIRVFFFFIFGALYSQETIISLVSEGVKFHDAGQYEKAIELYKKALDLDAKSLLANYEISYTYMAMKEYEKSIKHSDVIIEQNSKFAVDAYISKGSCLDYLGKTDESIKLFEEAINKFEPNYLLYYNLGLNYYNINNDKKSSEAIVNAIKLKSNHASSHFLLAKIMELNNNKTQCLLSLYYYLLLEPNSERSKTAINMMQNQFSGSITNSKDNPNQTNIKFNSGNSDSTFISADLMTTFLEVAKEMDENKEKTEHEWFTEKSKSFFMILGEQKSADSFYWNFYVPFFYNLAKSGHVEFFCYYIKMSTDEKAKEWVSKNPEKVKEFNNWISGN